MSKNNKVLPPASSDKNDCPEYRRVRAATLEARTSNGHHEQVDGWLHKSRKIVSTTPVATRHRPPNSPRIRELVKGIYVKKPMLIGAPVPQVYFEVINQLGLLGPLLLLMGQGPGAKIRLKAVFNYLAELPAFGSVGGAMSMLRNQDEDLLEMTEQHKDEVIAWRAKHKPVGPIIGTQNRTDVRNTDRERGALMAAVGRVAAQAKTAALLAERATETGKRAGLDKRFGMKNLAAAMVTKGGGLLAYVNEGDIFAKGRVPDDRDIDRSLGR
jgi:hypothetical protein